MTVVEVHRCIEAIGRLDDSAKGAYERIVADAQQAHNSWEPDLCVGAISQSGLMAAKSVALQLAVIREGGLHVLERAPAGGPLGPLSGLRR